MNELKQTEIGSIPGDWEVVRLRDVAKVKYGKAKPKIKGNIPVVGSSGIYDWADKTFMELPTLVIGRKGTAGEVYLFLEPCWPSDTTFYLEFEQNNVDLTFLYYFMSLNKLSGEHAKTTLPSVQRGDLENYKFPLPSLDEQQKITRVLSTIQRAIEQQDKIIEATRKLKKSLLHTLFTEGLNGEEQKETEIGLIPKSWDVVGLGDITEKTKQTDQRKNPNNKFKYIDVSGISNKFFQIVEFKEYLGKEAPSRARKMIKANDIIFATVRPYLKRVAIVPDAFDGEICSTAFCVVRCKREIANPIFVFNCLLNDTFVDKVSELQRGSSYPAVTDKDVLNQQIPFLPLSEQQQIAHILSTVDKKIAIEERRKATLKELFKSMLHKLMSGEMRLKEVEI